MSLTPWTALYSHLATCRLDAPGGVTGTYEKSVTGLPYVIAYALMLHDGVEAVAIVRVIHTSRDWPE